MTTNLSVNINKVATLRNARGENVPDVGQVAVDCESFGADGITVHPRPDERHIRREDVFHLRPLVKTEFNIEGYPTPEFMDLVLKIKPEQVTLVPDAPGVLTSSAGWVVADHLEFLTGIVDALREAGIRSSIFVDTDPEFVWRQRPELTVSSFTLSLMPTCMKKTLKRLSNLMSRLHALPAKSVSGSTPAMTSI